MLHAFFEDSIFLLFPVIKEFWKSVENFHFFLGFSELATIFEGLLSTFVDNAYRCRFTGCAGHILAFSFSYLAVK